ncbi:MAG: hypothetical protein LBO09_00590 [Candidatus Peribacteria bacterium]|jgi:hypothetical protein|nr:hypothetical protein [Candidatus Peribacteria bacterium]
MKTFFSLLFSLFILCTSCSWQGDDPFEDEITTCPGSDGSTPGNGSGSGSGDSNPGDGKYSNAPRAELGIDPDCYMPVGVGIRIVDENRYFIENTQLSFSKGNRGIHVLTHSSLRNRAIYFQFGEGQPIFKESVKKNGWNYFALQKKNHTPEWLYITIGSTTTKVFLVY